ncbi:hypothetical protein AMS68_002506 [Peltaster fructicola]|uniref:MHYT domain-containing protein n=1 Tax=Peltaster fructicola TaxID=286661 RepID=A0A6H0XQU5_9PEZI|nr:hypothetical protein AMS68_002506 [Peltaster fructicola]
MALISPVPPDLQWPLDLSRHAADAQNMSGYAVGDFVPSHFNASIVVASYFASLCGCVLTIELLHRRGTALGNVRSWLENLYCAVAFGVMGIWCMHYIGNRAIVMDNGQDELQLVYAPGFTTLSIFLPIFGLTCAFAAAEYPTKSPMLHWLALTGTGVLGGLSIVGMHYIGNMGIYNYDLEYSSSYLAASILIAIGDCLGVLVLFYTWRDKWISALWKRVPCAVFLAGGVSAMHFTATVGCKYRLKSLAQPGALQQTDVQVIIASALCGTAALITLGAVTLTRYRIWLRRQKAKKIMLLCVAFDENDRMLVTTEGVLPAYEISDKYNAANFSETFDTAHTVFHWCFRVSFNWSSVAELISRMKVHVAKYKSEQSQEAPRPASSASSTVYDPSSFSDYNVIFREQFCIAASNLATLLHLPLDKIGVLYDKIIETGTWAADEWRAPRNLNDIEMNLHKPVVFGRGQALVLVSHVSASMNDKLLNAGYKFATFQNVGRTIAESLQIPIEVVEAYYNDMRRYITNLRSLERRGTWLGFFAAVPLPHNRGFEVAVSRFDQNQLPDVQISSATPTQWQHQILLSMDCMKAQACLRHLEVMQRSSQFSVVERQFAASLYEACEHLAMAIPTQWWNDARFYAKALGAPYSCILTGSAGSTVMYNFMVVGDVHTSTDNMDAIKKIPFSFFAARQRVSRFARDHQILARDIHQEFGVLLGRKAPPKKKSPRKLRMPRFIRRRNARSPAPQEGTPIDGDSIASAETAVEQPGVAPPANPDGGEPQATAGAEACPGGDIYGGILVNSEFVISSGSTVDLTNHGHLNVGAVADASRDKQEDTFADELLQVALQRFMPPRPNY